MKVSIDGIHHGTRQGDTESPEYGDLFAVWGEKGPRKALFRHPVGNGLSWYAALARSEPVVDLHTIPYGGPSHD